MKKLSKINMRYFVLVYLFLFIGCTDEDSIVKLEGKISIAFFNNHPTDLHVLIYSMENTEIPIYELSPDAKGKIEININIGNYIIKPYAATTYYNSLGFQIKSDCVTSIVYNENNNGIVN